MLKTSYVMNVANTANVFEQLDEVNRIINVKLGSGLAKKSAKGLLFLLLAMLLKLLNITSLSRIIWYIP